MSPHLPLLEISGSPRDRGHAHGEGFREQIRALLPAYFDYLDRTSRSHRVEPLTKPRTLEIAGTYLGPADACAPDLLEEAQGIAEGAGVPFAEVLALNAFLDLFDYLSPAFVEAGCTTLMVPGGPDGTGAVIAQNYDLPSLFAPAAVLLKATRVGGPDALIYTTAGMLGCAGLNSAGIGVVINNLIPADAGPGLPYPFVVRRILSAERIGGAIDAVLASTPRASGMNYVLCDRHGEIYDLETSARDYEVLCPFDGPMAHANHYLTERLKPLERRAWDQRGQTIARWGRATRLLRTTSRPDAAALRTTLADHVNSPIAICRHEQDVGGEPCGQTICGIVLEPPRRRAHFARGPVCENEWVSYELQETGREIDWEGIRARTVATF
ncbi:MAG: hypothetical protein A3F84_13585 [Candidatus Handelsmanbacteria bacterium RIFCSPLOWO2_12_FULL_64_10]|uniref:Peptidase C45 hydrolase domain-containing protein n=1 Tax=Handelsmanbacteria sp. (strain RIFCSPLOWO2_12_FULL_64_10) TaxID=1817868 RepID=A0A1F6CVI7_HANXR|nr:MAG: hypothetical protein A3F84_13585 [Candidatus Handelsmanbacteria bacterium RIFCSPLOWO2_12_FULL_64_10]